MKHVESEIDNTDILLLSILRKRPRGVAPSAASLRAGVPMRSIVKSFRKLRKMKLVQEREAMLFLTKSGRQWILDNQSHFAFSGEKAWRFVPDEFRQPQLRAYTPYAPLRSKILKRAFRVDEDG